MFTYFVKYNTCTLMHNSVEDLTPGSSTFSSFPPGICTHVLLIKRIALWQRASKLVEIVWISSGFYKIVFKNLSVGKLRVFIWNIWKRCNKNIFKKHIYFLINKNQIWCSVNTLENNEDFYLETVFDMCENICICNKNSSLSSESVVQWYILPQFYLSHSSKML